MNVNRNLIPYTQIQGKMITFKSLLHMIDTLSTEDECREYLEELVWNGHPKCPYCSCSQEPWLLTSFGRFRGMYKCPHCRKRFNVKVGTMFEGSHIPLKKWFYAIYIFLAHKKALVRFSSPRIFLLPKRLHGLCSAE